MSRTLLVADDSVTIQKVVELTFSDSGHRVVGVGDGKAALETARELRPDLVLCDVIMPEMNGYDVCRQLKADPLTAGTPVLLLTGAFEPFDEDRARDCGADGHLTKPFESRVLLSRVEELLPASSPDATPEAPVEAPVEAAAVETAEPEGATFEPLAWDEEPEPEALAFEPAPPAFEPAPPAFEPEAGAVFVPETETPAAPGVSFADSEDWLEPEGAEPSSTASADPVFSPEPAGAPPPDDRDRVASGLDENPIVLEEEPGGGPSAPVFSEAAVATPAPPAPDSLAPFDLAHALADPSLRRMVEEAVERVVRDVVREVAWEIVPDLTETLLRQAERDQD